MPQAQQKIVFTKGMNFDDSPEVLQEGEGRHRLNVRVLSSDNDENQAAETMLGNTLTAYSLPAGNNTVIGTYQDKTRGKVYAFVFNSTNKHIIYEYTIDTNAIAKVLQEAILPPYYLNFNIDYLITGINVVELDENNHLLYWTDYYNQPKKINIEKAKFFSVGDFVNGYKSPFDPDITYRIKKPQLSAPTYIWQNDATQLINYLWKKLFLVKTQFVFDDKEVSSFSPISKYVLPITTDDGKTGEDIATQYNKMLITVQTGSSIVTKIRIAAKEYASADFKIIAELDKKELGIADNTTYNFPFYNNGNYIIVEVNESIKLFDNVPFLSQAQECIDGIRITDGNIVEGTDPVNIDMRIPVSYVPVSLNPNPFYPKVSYLKNGGSYKMGLVYYDGKGNRSGATNVVNGKTTELVNDRYGTTLFLPFLTDPLYASPHAAPAQGLDYENVIVPEIYNQPPPTATHYQLLRSKNEAMDRYIQFAAANVTYVGADNVTIVAPAAATYVHVYINNITGIYKDENANSQLVYTFIKGDRIRFIANYTWTALAVGGGFVLAPAGGNSPFPALYAGAPAAQNAIDPLFAFNDNEVIQYDTGTGLLILKMNASVPNNLYPGVLFEVYQPAENVIDNNEIMYEMGECREITTDIHGNLVHKGDTTDQLIETMTASTYAAPLLVATVLAGHGLAVNDKVKVIGTTYSVYGIVTVSGATSVTINTTGFAVVGVYNMGVGIVDRAAVFTVTGGGDSFRRQQDMPFVLNATYRLYMFVDAENVSNMFASKAWDVGRPNRIDPTYKRGKKIATVYHSEKFIPLTNINGLSTVYDASFQDYDSRFGGIYKLYNENQRLICLQELKSSQIPISQIIYNDLQLNSTVGASTNVLTTPAIYYDGEYGIGKNPESFAVYGHAKYYIDARRGVLLRLSMDGLTPISITANMHNYFTDKCKAVMGVNGVNPKIYGVYDIKFNEYIIAFADVKNKGGQVVVTGETLAFNEKYNAFSTFYSFKPEFMCGINTDIVTFKNGGLWVHNSNSATFNNFYGVQYKSQLWAIVNAAPSNKKVFLALSEETAAAWSANLSTPSGQATVLVIQNFQNKEGFQYSNWFRDQNTVNVLNPVVNGNVMRGQTALLQLEYQGTDYNKIFAANVLFINSERSGH